MHQMRDMVVVRDVLSSCSPDAQKLLEEADPVAARLAGALTAAPNGGPKRSTPVEQPFVVPATKVSVTAHQALGLLHRCAAPRPPCCVALPCPHPAPLASLVCAQGCSGSVFPGRHHCCASNHIHATEASVCPGHAGSEHIRMCPRPLRVHDHHSMHLRTSHRQCHFSAALSLMPAIPQQPMWPPACPRAAWGQSPDAGSPASWRRSRAQVLHVPHVVACAGQERLGPLGRADCDCRPQRWRQRWSCLGSAHAATAIRHRPPCQRRRQAPDLPLHDLLATLLPRAGGVGQSRLGCPPRMRGCCLGGDQGSAQTGGTQRLPTPEPGDTGCRI